MIKLSDSKSEVFKKMEQEIEWMVKCQKHERFSRFCWLANQVDCWETRNWQKII